MPGGRAQLQRRAPHAVPKFWHTLKALLKENGLSTAVGDEGGFAPDLPDAKEALRFLKEAVEKAGYEMGKDIQIALDVAASELADRRISENTNSREKAGCRDRRSSATAEELIRVSMKILSLEFPIRSIEDPLDEEDWDGWELFGQQDWGMSISAGGR